MRLRGCPHPKRRRLSAEEEARAAPAPTSAPPLVEDVPSIVFQGLGATLIVYLAGVGGLGAVSTTAPELDPYVLMLGCFTAAVFSDDVWRWARDWVQKQRPLG